MLITVDEGQITNIAVHPDHRRKGYGAAITRALLRHAKDAKLESVSLEVRVSNTAAIELYKKAGFAEAGRRKGFYAKPTEDALVMVCKIK
jgi:ribosomal-protein-alanine N-acetyltransferase